MSFLRPSAVKQTTITTATGTLALIANSGDTRSFQTALGTGPVKCRYMIRGNGYFEMGRGTFTAPSTLARDEIITSSNSDNAVSIPPGTSDVYLLDYFQFQTDRFSASKVLTNKDASNSWVFTGSSAASLTLPALSTALPDFWGVVKNIGTAILTLTCAGSDTLDENGLGTLALLAGESAYVFHDYNAGTSATWRVLRFTPPGMVKLATLTASNSASLADTASLSKGYSSYLFVLRDIVPASSGATLGLRFSTNGGSSYDSASSYGFAMNYASGVPSTGNAGQNSATRIVLHGSDLKNSANNSLCGKVVIYDPLNANYKRLSYETVHLTSSDNLLATAGSGVHFSSAAVNAVQFLMDTGNITSGTIDVYGIK